MGLKMGETHFNPAKIVSNFVHLFVLRNVLSPGKVGSHHGGGKRVHSGHCVWVYSAYRILSVGHRSLACS